MLSGFYRFKSNRDVAFEVVKAFYVKEKRLWNVKVNWWNIGSCHDPYPMLVTQRINIPEALLPTIEKVSLKFRVPAEENAPRFY